MKRPRVLVLADQCNPEWPSLPIVGYKYARELAQYADIHLVTHVRNRPAIEAANDMPAPVHYVDTEWLASPVYRLSQVIRGGNEVAWSMAAMMAYPTYLAFELQAWRRFRKAVRAGEFDLIHRITPMSPTIPSPIAKRSPIPFLLGPLNGSLDWPEAYRAEMRREKERARALRTAYRYMPYARSTQKLPACILAAFDHTTRDLVGAPPERIISFPEIGFDPELFHTGERTPAFAHPGPYEFLFVGRLVPYKLAEAVVRAFVSSPTLRNHRLSIIGDGPERPRLEAIIREADAGDVVALRGKKTQSEVADAMRRADAFVFPSIRELGAGVVIEAMACGALNIVADYGAPGALVGRDRGIAVPMAPLKELIQSLRERMEECIQRPEAQRKMAEAGTVYAFDNFTWERKAYHSVALYDAVLSGRPLAGVSPYR